ncbi:MAG TPA: hypothetical protein ENJ19_10375 [Gammaproteobacteria bacterium]|nr:hypothetical protein [Gammaproteobacteria bacterium]
MKMKPYLCAALALTASLATAAPQITVDPTTVTFGKSATVELTLAEALPAQARLSLLPAVPTITQRLALPAEARDVLHLGNTLWVAAGAAGLLAVDGATGEPVARLETGNYRRLARAGEALLALDDSGGLTVFDVADAAAPAVIGHYAPEAAIRQFAGRPGYAALVLADGRLQILELAAATGLRAVAERPLPFTVQAIAAQGAWLYFAAGPNGVQIWNWADATAPEPVADYPSTGPARALALAGKRAYVGLGRRGLLVLDVSAPDAPRWLGSHSRLGEVDGVTALADRVWVRNTAGRFLALDAGIGDMPETVAAFPAAALPAPFAAAPGTLWLGQDGALLRLDFGMETPRLGNEGLDVGRGVNFGGERRLWLQGDVAYVADWFSGIHMYDIADPARPRLLASLHTPGSPKGVAVRGNYAFIADDDHGLQVADVADPRRPRLVAHLPTPGLAYIPKLAGDRLYLAGHRGGFQIIDIADPLHPRLITSVTTAGMAWGIEPAGDTLYVADDQAGLLIYDVQQPATPLLLAQYNPGGRLEDVLVAEDLAYLTFFDQGLKVLDVADPVRPKPVAELATPGNARGLDRVGQTLFLADWLAGVHAVDVSNPARPRLLGSYDTPGAAWGVKARGETVFVADWWGGFEVLDFSDPRRPTLNGQYHRRGEIQTLATQGPYLYAAQDEGGLQIFDIKNTLNPTWITGVDLPAPARQVAVSGDLAAVGTPTGLALIDISNPYQARLAAWLDTDQAVTAVAVAHGAVYAAQDEGDVLVIDATTPRKPRIVERLPVDAAALWLTGDSLWLVEGDGTVHQRATADWTAAPLSRHATGYRGLAHGTTERLYLYRRHGGVTVWGRTSEGWREGATVALGPLRALKAEQRHLYALGERSLWLVDASDIQRPRIIEQRPLLNPARGLAVAAAGAVYLGGQDIVTALKPMPPLGAARRDERRFQLTLDKSLPLGDYDLGIASAGTFQRFPRALTVAMPKFGKPRFTVEDLKRIMEQRRRASEK